MIDADALIRGVASLSCPVATFDSTYWIEDERLLVATGGAPPQPALPNGHTVRSDLYGYGAMPYAVRHSTIFFVDATDQALYRCEGDRVSRLSPSLVDTASVTRFGAPAPSPDGQYVYCVREREFGSRTVHDLVRLAADNSGDLRVMAEGHDFYGAPVPHPDGSAIAFLTWDLGNMPWDESRLWELSLTETGDPRDVELVSGDPGVSVTQPAYGPDGLLRFVSDRAGWWNLYQRHPSRAVQCLAQQDAEFGRPDWFCGKRTYGFTAQGGVVAVACRSGRDQVIRIRGESTKPVPVPLDAVDFLTTSRTGDVVVIGGAPDRATGVFRISATTGETDVVRTSWPDAPDRAKFSVPEALTAHGDDGHPVHALFYPPVDPIGSGPVPLMVSCHGGPTIMAGTAMDVQVQFWTSRGFAVLAVNYRGSPGFGRAYRQSIRGRWGVLDVEDCLTAVRHLLAAGTVDPARIVVRGRSSGGLTALRMAAVAERHGVRVAAVIGVSSVTDPADLPDRTHKMESRYLDGLIGPWPADRARYENRSIFASLPTVTSPVLLVHGAKDPVVPVEQAQRLRDALVARGVPVELVTFDDEGHAIRRADNIRRAVQAEQDFLRHALGGRW